MISIITSNFSSPGSLALKQAAETLGIEARVCLVGDDATPQVINTSDRVLYRIGPESFNAYRRMLNTLTHQSHWQLLKHSLDAFDKCESYRLLEKAAIKMPASYILSTINSPPFLPGVLKIAHGNQGKGVVLVASFDQYQTTLKEYIEQDGQCLYQEYIEESRGIDKRLIVCGSSVVAAMQRTAQEGEFRANIHLGATATVYRPTETEISLAINATAALKLPYAGVDIIDSVNGPLVLEVNPSPGFAISSMTGTDVAREVMRCVVERRVS